MFQRVTNCIVARATSNLKEIRPKGPAGLHSLDFHVLTKSRSCITTNNKIHRGSPRLLNTRFFWSNKPLHAKKSVRSQPKRNVAPAITEEKKKNFLVNGAIDTQKRLIYCYVDPEPQLNSTLIPGIREGSYIMLHGPRASGKSTIMYRAQELLKDEFVCLTVSLQGLDCSDISVFWRNFSEAMHYANKHVKVPPMTSAEDFRRFVVSNKRTKLFGGKKVVLFIDEFDTLSSAPKDVLGSILNTLRAIKQEGAAYCLQSFIGVGPFSILQLTGQTMSPFNVKDSMQIQYWSKEQVHQLFKQHETKVDSKIIDDVYERTAGHPGLVCICGKQITTLQIGTYRDWLNYALSKLLRHAANWPTLIKMEEALTDPAKGAVRAVLRQVFLPNLTEPVEIDIDSKEVKYLAAEGALVTVPPENFTYRIPSPFIHQLLLQRVNTVDQHCIPSTPIPWHSIPGQGMQLDVQHLLVQAIACINPEVIKTAPRIAWKNARVPGLQGVAVPQEAVYHTELFAILRQWLAVDVSVISEVKVKTETSTQSCDLALRYPNHTTLLELVATSPISKIQEHIDRAASYKETLEAQEAWVINFTLQKPNNKYMYTSLKSEDTKILHVWHNELFTDVQYWSNEEDKFIPIKLIQ